MVKEISVGFKFVYLFLFIIAFATVLGSIDLSFVFDILNLLSAFDYLIAVTQLVAADWLIVIIVSTTIVIYTALYSILKLIPFLDLIMLPPSDPGVQRGLSELIDNLNKIKLASYPSSSVLSEITDPFLLIDEFSGMFGQIIILICLAITIFGAIGFFIKSETNLAIFSFIGLQITFMLAMYTKHLVAGFSTIIVMNDIVSMLLSPLFTLGFLLYLVLEIAFQSAYASNIIDPMVERERRISEHLKRIRAFKPAAIEGDRTTEGKNLSSSQGKKFDILAASYIREMVDKHIYKKGEAVRDDKTTMRLQSYIASLSTTDRDFEKKLTAQSAQPEVMAIIIYMIPMIAIRVILVILATWLILNPVFILDILQILPSFPELRESIELLQPEFRTIMIFNTILIIIIVAAIVHFFLYTKAEMKPQVQKVDTLVDFATSPDEYEEEEIVEDDLEEELGTS